MQTFFLMSALGLRPEIIEWFREDQAFSTSNDLAPPSSPPPSPVSKLSLFLNLLMCRRLSLQKGEGGWGRSQIIRRRQVLVLYKSLNTLWVYGQSNVWRLPKYWPPHPLTARRVCSTPPLLVRGEDTLAGWRGGWGSMVRKMPWASALFSICIYVSTLWSTAIADTVAL